MPNFKDQSGAVHFLSDADVERGLMKLLPASCVEIADGEAQMLLIPSSAQLWETHQAQAQDELDFSDKVCTRCMKAGVPYPTTWDARDQLLRAIVMASTGDPMQPLPMRPAYPANT